MKTRPPTPHHQESGKPAINDFLHALFDDLDGHIEIRQIEDKQEGKLVHRKWYSAPDALLAELEDLLHIAERTWAGVFYGVLPRPDGKGTTADALPGRVVWSDLDFKDYEGGEEEARKRLAELPIQPSIIVHSGHGLHVFWLLHEAEDAPVLSRLSKGLARVLGGDHTFDAARMLRLPGTLNRKEPEHPVPVEIEVLEPERTYNASEIGEALELLGWDPEAEPSKSSEPRPVAVGEQMSAPVLALLDRHRYIRELFEGKGKLAVGADGKRLDTSSSGYDFSLGLALALRGVTDPSDLATAIACRPDGAAQAKGTAYLGRTVASVLERVEATRDDYGPLDFEVEHVRVFGSDRPEYELTVEGKVFRLTSAAIQSPKRFSTAFMDALRRVPHVPSKPAEWYPIVNGWLEGAEHVELGDDASEEAALRESVAGAIEALDEGEEVEDLDAGLALVLESGERAFKVAAILKRLREEYPHVRRNTICRILRVLGYGPDGRRVGGKAVRVWLSQ